MSEPFNRDEWWAAENAARSRELEHGHIEMIGIHRQLRDEVTEVFKDHSIATRIVVLAHLMVEAAALPTILPGNVLESSQFKEAIKMVKHALDVQARSVIPQKLGSEYGVRLAIRVKAQEGKDSN